MIRKSEGAKRITLLLRSIFTETQRPMLTTLPFGGGAPSRLYQSKSSTRSPILSGLLATASPSSSTFEVNLEGRAPLADYGTRPRLTCAIKEMIRSTRKTKKRIFAMPAEAPAIHQNQEHRQLPLRAKKSEPSTA